MINSLLSVGNFPIYSYTDLGYPNAINGDANLSVDDRLGAAEFLRDIGVNPDGSPAAAGPANGHGLASFSYMVLPEDHTTGLGATFTPRAEVAQNDAAPGDIISRCRTPGLVLDRRVRRRRRLTDGIDHADGHRNVLLSQPHTKHVSFNGSTAGIGQTFTTRPVPFAPWADPRPSRPRHTTRTLTLATCSRTRTRPSAHARRPMPSTVAGSVVHQRAKSLISRRLRR